MTSLKVTFPRYYAKFVGVTLVSGLLVAGVGYAIVKQTLGGEGVGAMLTGCGISAIAGCLGSIPIAMALSQDGLRSNATPILMATFVRFAAVLFLVVAAIFGGSFDRPTLVLSTALSYLLMLAIDTVVSINAMNRRIGNSR